MSHDIGIGQVEESLKLHSNKAWIFLYEIHVGTSEVAYLTTYDEEVVYDSNTYYPYPMTDPVVPESGSTNATTAIMTVYNVDDLITNRLRDEELIGNSMFIRLVHEDYLSETDIIAHEVEILGAESVREEGAVRITIGVQNWLNKIVGRRYKRLYCDNVYGDALCGYDKDRTGAMATCSKLYSDGSNGCVEHGDDEASKGLYVLHPQRFSGHPGIPSQNRG